MTSSFRPTAVAGRFYPENPAELSSQVRRLLGDTRLSPALAVMAPHAGYIFSGATAGRVFGAIDVPDRVIVLGPNHTGRGRPLSVWPDGVWELPTGNVPIDAELTAAIFQADPRFEPDLDAHLGEHGTEVELPFLQARNPNLRVVPIVVSRVRREAITELGLALAAVIREVGAPVLLVASSDMSHFIPADRAAVLDQMAFDRIEALDPLGLYDVVRENRITMCGAQPTAITLVAAIELGATKAKVIDYTHSGMVTGDDSSVVAYAGAVIT
jgi:AmmeMemoRadiSam system protein B